MTGAFTNAAVAAIVLPPRRMTWLSVAPTPAFFVDTGVQFSMEPYRGGFLVTDGHHNRVLWVERDGSVHEFATFGNVVPTGLETTGGHVFVTQMGPIPHEPEHGKVVAVRAGGEPFEVASGASMLIDVEKGPRGLLYGVSQGQWDGVGEARVPNRSTHGRRRRTARTSSTARSTASSSAKVMLASTLEPMRLVSLR